MHLVVAQRDHGVDDNVNFRGQKTVTALAQRDRFQPFDRGARNVRIIGTSQHVVRTKFAALARQAQARLGLALNFLHVITNG